MCYPVVFRRFRTGSKRSYGYLISDFKTVYSGTYFGDHRRNLVTYYLGDLNPVVHISMENVNVRTTYPTDRKSTRLNSSHVKISYAVFCLKKKVQFVAGIA